MTLAAMPLSTWRREGLLASSFVNSSNQEGFMTVTPLRRHQCFCESDEHKGALRAFNPIVPDAQSYWGKQMSVHDESLGCR